MVRDEDIRNCRAEGGKAGSEHGCTRVQSTAQRGRLIAKEGGFLEPLRPPLLHLLLRSTNIRRCWLCSSSGRGPRRPTGADAHSPTHLPQSRARQTARTGEVLALWAEVLPQLPQHLPNNGGTRADHLRARRETAVLGWQTQDDGFRYLRKLFGFVGSRHSSPAGITRRAAVPSSSSLRAGQPDQLGQGARRQIPPTEEYA